MEEIDKVLEVCKKYKINKEFLSEFCFYVCLTCGTLIVIAIMLVMMKASFIFLMGG